MQINSLEDLKNLNCPPLVINKINIAEEYPELIFERNLDSTDERFKIDHSNEQLETGIITLKTYETDLLLPYDFTHNEETYKSYNNLIDYLVTYRSAHLLQITLRFGVKVLKKSDEQHLHDIIIQRLDLCFRYDFSDKKWKQAQQDVFATERAEIEKYKDSEEFAKITKNYMIAMSMIHNDSKLYLNQKIIKNGLKEFYEIKNILNEISDKHKELLNNDVDRIFNVMALMNDDSLDAIEKSNAKSDSTLHLRKPGYYVDNNRFYPNILRFYQLTQKADEYRSEKSLIDLNDFLLDFHTKRINTRKNAHFIDMSSADFTTSYKHYFI